MKQKFYRKREKINKDIIFMTNLVINQVSDTIKILATLDSDI
jgi:phosphate uptake regulator